MLMSMIRFTMANPGSSPEEQASMHAAMLEMCEYADNNGFMSVVLSEHHGAENNWTPSPILLAGMVAARTKNVVISLSAALAPLYDPLRLAEDLAVVDLASRGRVMTVAGLGYRPSEYALLGKDFAERGKIMDHVLETMLAAWRDGTVTPAPYTKPHPPVFVGGESKIAARRAARFGLPFQPVAHLPELQAYYEEQCKEHGTNPVCIMPAPDYGQVHVSEDPERDWAEIGPCFLDEATTYAGWQTGKVSSAVHTKASTIDELRATGIYNILTPEECIKRIKDGKGMFSFHPLCNGISIEKGWESLNLFVEQVLPAASAA
ncbi:MAG: hypothetical protein QOG53_1302 [Frankiales bacterium]|jgi:alkanesulfonate monooxygenase SsuD/methylene tetrahydromethanopterin reductase-like flavin-dependent oxidoreductase (luciferase family)|nr:hypothetical protein [Frankiales bacterium]